MAVVTAGVSLLYCFVVLLCTTLYCFCCYGSHDTTINPCCQVLFLSKWLKRVTTTSCLLITTALSHVDSIVYSGLPLQADSLSSLDWIVKEQFHGIRI